MQKRKMNGVDITLVTLQIVALFENFGHGPVFLRDREKFIIWQQGSVAGSHVRENYAAEFLGPMSAMANVMSVGAAARLAGLLKNSAANIIKPAVIETYQAVVFDAAVTQIGASVGTVQSQQTRAVLVVA